MEVFNSTFLIYNRNGRLLEMIKFKATARSRVNQTINVFKNISRDLLFPKTFEEKTPVLKDLVDTADVSYTEHQNIRINLYSQQYLRRNEKSYQMLHTITRFRCSFIRSRLRTKVEINPCEITPILCSEF